MFRQLFEFDPVRYVKETKEATRWIRHRIKAGGYEDFRPAVALILGSGLDDVAGLIKRILVLDYRDIPYFPVPTTDGHAGEMIIGTLEGVPIIGLSGRRHYYEVAHKVHGIAEVVFPVHVMANLGVELYIGTNAVGALNPNFKVGDMVLVKSHRNLNIPNPLAGPHLNFGDNVRFQPQTNNDMYQPEFRSMFRKAARDAYVEHTVQDGFYAALTGPTYESRAEARELMERKYDIVGMSLAPEVVVAANRNLGTLGVSVVTNVIDGNGENPASHEEVKRAVRSIEVRSRIWSAFKGFFKLYAQRRFFVS